MMKPQRCLYVPTVCMIYGKIPQTGRLLNYFFATCPHRNRTEHFPCITAYGKNCSKKAYPKMRLLLFTTQTQRLKKMNYSRKCEAVMFVCFSAPHQKWVPEQMCKNCSMPRTTLTARGVRQTLNREPGVSSDKAIQIKRCIFTAM